MTRCARRPACLRPRLLVRSGALRAELSRDLLLERGRDRLVVAERQHSLADNLAAFVAFSGNKQNIARLKCGDRTSDRLTAIADLRGAARGREDCGPDGSGILAAWIVVRQDHAVGLLGRDRPQERALAGIAVAARPENNN